jgi:hypothetical protein
VVNGERIEVNQHVYNLSQMPKIKSDVRRVIAPLESEGFDVFEARDGDRLAARVTREEVSDFEPTDDEPDFIFDSENDALIEVIRPSFQLGNKWAVSDGRSNFYVDMQDDVLVGLVQKGEVSFRKGDVLRVRLRTRSWCDDNTLKSRNTVAKVLEIIPAKKPMQSALFDRPS